MAKFEMLDRHVKVGSAILHIRLRTPRCPATQVNPETTTRDGLDRARSAAVAGGVQRLARRRAGHNAPHCFVDPHPYFIAASNLTGTKARLLLMACLWKFGSLPPARHPVAPTPDEQAALRAAVAGYQAVFDTH